MDPYSLSTLRSALGNVDSPTRRTVRMPSHSWSPAVADRDFRGWRDPSAPQRGYLFVETDNGLEGIMLTTTRSRTATQRAVMCEFCRLPRRFEQVVLFSAPVSAQKRDRSSFGTYLCVDLDCNARVNVLRPVTQLDPPAEELVATRRAQLAIRARAFVADVLARATSN